MPSGLCLQRRQLAAALVVLAPAPLIPTAQTRAEQISAGQTSAAPSPIGSTRALPKNFALRVDVSLSHQAAARLSSGEGIVVSASFEGEPTAAARRHAGNDGHVDLGTRKAEIPGRPGEAILHGDTSTMPLHWIAGPILLNINIFSARHTSLDNVLSCDIFDGPLDHALRHPLPLHCALITEKEPTRVLN